MSKIFNNIAKNKNENKMNFKTTINVSDYEFIGTKEDQYLSGSITINWSIDVQLNSFGIKSISAYLIELESEITDDNYNDFDVSDYECDFDVSFDSGSFQINDCTIDINNKKIYIQ